MADHVPATAVQAGMADRVPEMAADKAGTRGRVRGRAINPVDLRAVAEEARVRAGMAIQAAAVDTAQAQVVPGAAINVRTAISGAVATAAQAVGTAEA
jgi:hypothetical protein